MAKGKYKIKDKYRNNMVYTSTFKSLGKDLTQEQMEELMSKYILKKPAKTHPYIDIVEGAPKPKTKEVKTKPVPPKKINENETTDENE